MTDTKWAAQLFGRARELTSRRLNGVKKIDFSGLEDPRLSKRQLIFMRDRLRDAVGALRPATQKKYGDESMLQFATTNCAIQFGLFREVLDHIIPDSSLSDEARGLRATLSEKLRKNKKINSRYDPDQHVAHHAVTLIEETVPRATALRVRTDLAEILVKDAAQILGLNWTPGEMRRSAEFPAETKQALIALLSYFSRILDTKYPGIRASVSIEQEKETVTLVVRSEERLIEQIDAAFEDYGLVVIGEMAPDELLPNSPQEVLALKHKLELVQLELRQVKEMRANENAAYSGRIERLEDEIKFMRGIFSREQYVTRELVSNLGKISSQLSPLASKSLTFLTESLERGDMDIQSPEFGELMRQVARDDPSFLDRLNELIIRGSISGTLGNYIYAVLRSLMSTG